MDMDMAKPDQVTDKKVNHQDRRISQPVGGLRQIYQTWLRGAVRRMDEG